jgi:hypothetical protein
MKKIFSKSSFPKAPGGDRYNWEDAQTVFKVSKVGLFVIKVIAAAKNAKQNHATDDDDLRVALDGFHFGKYRRHKEKISWKGFGASSSWDGASLKSGTKPIYFFARLGTGNHKLEFFADMTPTLKNLEVFEIEDDKFELTNLVPPEEIESNRKGVPWLSFVFLGTPPKSILLDVDVKSGKTKTTSDGDNLKVVINGEILQNKKAPTSKKYRNFYFSGDIKSANILSIDNKSLTKSLAFENSVELWYDGKPKISSSKISFFDTEEFLKELKPLADLRKYVLFAANFSLAYFKFDKRTYSKKFLEHSLKSNPSSLEFKSNHPVVRKIKNDPLYGKIRKAIKENLDKGLIEGEIYPVDFNFTSSDLDTSIHGIKKIEYKAKKKRNGDFEVYFELYDVYDFARGDMPFSLFGLQDSLKQKMINLLDTGEELGVVSNFEILIHVKDIL